jgi:ribosomal protein S18 acetylase RimI-like enzyme
MSEIKNFINSKKFKYHVVKEEDYFDFIIEHDIKLEKQSLSDRYRDHVFVTDNSNDNVVAYTALMKDYSFPTNKTDDAMTMATIYVNSEYRNQGISKKLIEVSLEHIKNENKLFIRTKPSNDGSNFSFDRITKMSNDLELNFIPHNLSFVYQALENKNVLKNKSIEEKMEVFNTTCDNLLNHFELKKDNITKIDHITEIEHQSVLNTIIKNNPLNKNRVKI